MRAVVFEHRWTRLVLAGCAFLPASLPGQAPSASADALSAQATRAQEQGDLPAAIQSYEALIRIQPRLAEAYNNLGALYYDTGQYQKAANTLQQCVKLSPRLTPARTMLGASLLALGNARAARPELEAAVAAAPADARAQDLLQRTLIALDDFPAAARLLQRRVDRDPQNQDALYQLGRLYLELSQQTLLRARAVQPDSAVSHLMEGEIDEGAGNMAQAEQQYRTAATKAPDRADVHEHLGNVYWLQGLWSQARTEFASTLQLDPGNCSARWKMADTLLNEHQQTEDALNLLQTAIRGCPHLDQARVDRAKALLELQRVDEALPDLLEAEKNSPEEPTIHFLLAKAYRARHQDGQAAAETELFAKLTAQQGAPVTNGQRTP